MDVQKVQIHDLGASGFIPSLDSRYEALAKRINSSAEEHVQRPHYYYTNDINMKVYLECSDLNLSWFYSVNTLFMNNNSWRIRIERTCREERENLGQLKHYSS